MMPALNSSVPRTRISTNLLPGTSRVRLRPYAISTVIAMLSVVPTKVTPRLTTNDRPTTLLPPSTALYAARVGLVGKRISPPSRTSWGEEKLTAIT